MMKQLLSSDCLTIIATWSHSPSIFLKSPLQATAIQECNKRSFDLTKAFVVRNIGPRYFVGKGLRAHSKSLRALWVYQLEYFMKAFI